MDISKFNIIREIGTVVHEEDYLSSSSLIWKENFTKFEIILYKNNVFLIKEKDGEIRMVKVIKSNGIILKFIKTYGADDE